jgi:hypothetical protein
MVMRELQSVESKQKSNSERKPTTNEEISIIPEVQSDASEEPIFCTQDLAPLMQTQANLNNFSFGNR